MEEIAREAAINSTGTTGPKVSEDECCLCRVKAIY